MILLTLTVAAPQALAADASCGRLERCRIYYFQLFCEKYPVGIPAALTDEELATGFFRRAMEEQNCTLPDDGARRHFERCEAAAGIAFTEGEAHDCAALLSSDQ